MKRNEVVGVLKVVLLSSSGWVVLTLLMKGYFSSRDVLAFSVGIGFGRLKRFGIAGPERQKGLELYWLT